MRVIRATLAVIGVLLLISAPAEAGKTKMYAPPGKAGTSQYAEDIPSAGGAVLPPSSTGGNKTAAQISKLGAGRVGVHRLAKLGKKGAAAAQLAQQTAPARAPSRPKSTGVVHPRVALTASRGSAIAGLGQLIGGSGVDGIGFFLPLLLVLGLIGAGVLGLFRLRNPG